MPLKNTPARMYIMNLSQPTNSPDSILEAQFNPAELEESLSVNWNKLAVLGFSHMPLQYQQTDNHSFTFELAFHAMDNDGGNINQLLTIAYARRFLLACCYASRTSTTGAPPRVRFCWPQIASLTSIVRKLAIKFTQFNRQGDPVVFTARVTLEEIRDARLYADDVLSHGTLRDPE